MPLNPFSMTRFKLTILLAALLPLNLLFAKQSLLTWHPVASISPYRPSEADSIDIATFIQLSRKEYEINIGHALTKQERRAFRKAKRKLRHQMAVERNKNGNTGLIIGGAMIVVGLPTAFLGIIKTSECENPPYCEDGDTEKTIGLSLIIVGAIVTIASLIKKISSREKKLKQ